MPFGHGCASRNIRLTFATGDLTGGPADGLIRRDRALNGCYLDLPGGALGTNAGRVTWELRMSNDRIDVPLGKLAAVVTSLEMFSRPLLRSEHPGPGWHLQHVWQPDLGWFRDLFRRVGLNWLWFSRLQMSNTALASIIHHPAVSVYSLQIENRDEGILELDFREPDVCELSFFGVTQELIGTPAGRWLMNRAI